MSPLAIIAAGGTGGHMFPAQALAEGLLAEGWRVQLFTDGRGARFAGGFPGTVERVVLSSATFARGGILARLAVPFRILGGVFGARRRMVRDRPAVVVGFGGYPSIPALGAAWLSGLPRMLHEQNGVLGRVNQLFARRVELVACGTWPTQLPAGIEGVHTGNPVRGAVLAQAGAVYEPPGGGCLRVLVFGGSQGARVISDVVPEALAALPPEMRARLRVVQQARPEDEARVTAAYEAAGISAEVTDFIGDLPERMAASQLVICRSGASSVADVAVIGRPAIFVPLASAIRDEQTANARALLDSGAAVVLPEKVFDAARLSAEVLAILSDRARASQMAEAALRCGRPDATGELIKLVKRLGNEGG